MLSFIIAAFAGLVLGGLYAAIFSFSWWSFIGFGIIGIGLALFLINRWTQKPLNAIFAGVQGRMQKANDEIQRKANQFQSRPGGNQVAFQKAVEKIQKQAAEEAVGMLDACEEYYKWNMLIKKQVDTMKFQLNFQMKSFAAADKYIDNVIMINNPVAACMKMARIYDTQNLKKGDLEADKAKAIKDWKVTAVYKKATSRVRGSNGALVYSTYAWMLVKNGLIDEAVEVLLEGIKKCKDEHMTQNLERLRNDKVKHFSNSKYGETWYALYLENPPKQKQKVVRQRGNQRGGRPF